MNADRGGAKIAADATVLGWEPRVGLHEGLENTLSWLREEGYGR